MEESHKELCSCPVLFFFLSLSLFFCTVSGIMVVHPNKNLLLKYADETTLSVPIRSLVEVQNILRWSIENCMTLNLKTTCEMAVIENAKKPIPESVKDIDMR